MAPEKRPAAVPRPGPHGGDGPRVAAALGLDPGAVLDLSQTLNPFAPDPAEVVAKHLDAVARYPDAAVATAALAAAIGVDPDRVVLTNGGAEAISLVTAEVGGTVASEPEFALHPRLGTGARWRSDPHNPSGRLAPPDERADVWDEAFYPLATGRWTAGRPGWVVGSLTKVLACPGLRIGYVIAPDPGAAARMAVHQPQWSVNGIAVSALPDLLASVDLPAWCAAISGARAELVIALAGHDLTASAGKAPWVLVKSSGLRDRLAVHGVVVRDCSSFGLENHVRIAVPDRAGLARLQEALCAVG
jgi:histidinol-phosphate/aromatic aminotransferase/cobyric acid decarboxylase-like protein